MELFLYTSKGIYTHAYYHFNMIEELENILLVKADFLAQVSPRKGIHVFFCFAKEIFQNVSWFKSLKGPKIVIEHDAYLNFMKDSEFYQAWTKFYKTTRFSLLISSGKRTTEKLLEDGIPTKWVAKGTNSLFLKIPNLFTGRIGYFGKPIAERDWGTKFHFYEKRYEMAQKLEGKIECIESDVKDFARTVAKFSAGCTNDSQMEEPMAKHFEMSALGCVPIRDCIPELFDLGYDENSMMIYNSFDEMLQIVDFLKKNPERLVFMQKKTKEIAKHQTWSHRANEINHIILNFFKLFC